MLLMRSEIETILAMGASDPRNVSTFLIMLIVSSLLHPPDESTPRHLSRQAPSVASKSWMIASSEGLYQLSFPVFLWLYKQQIP